MPRIALEGFPICCSCIYLFFQIGIFVAVFSDIVLCSFLSVLAVVMLASTFEALDEAHRKQDERGTLETIVLRAVDHIQQTQQKNIVSALCQSPGAKDKVCHGPEKQFLSVTCLSDRKLVCWFGRFLGRV